MLSKTNNKKDIKNSIPSNDSISTFSVSILNTLHSLLPNDLTKIPKEEYIESMREKIKKEEIIKLKHEQECNIQELDKTNYNLIYYNLLLSLLEHDPRYNKQN